MNFPKKLSLYLGTLTTFVAFICMYLFAWLMDFYELKELWQMALLGAGSVALITFGVLIIFHQLAGKHITKLCHLNTNTTTKQFLIFPEKEIPAHELGENIRTRNHMVLKMKEHQENLERVLEEVKDELIDQAKLSAIGELTAVISHDLKNPLTIVEAYVHRLNELVKTGDLDRQKFSYALEKTIAALDRIIRLVEQMNRFKNEPFQPIENVKLLKVIDNALVLLDSKIKGHGIVIHKSYLEKCPPVWADPVQVEQVIINLVFNSFKGLKNSERKEIVFDFVDNGDMVTIFMEDTGPGISTEDREAVFKPFQSTKSFHKGTGLGLSICSQIMERHGTRLTLENNPGGGAKFSIRFYKKPIGKVSQAA